MHQNTLSNNSTRHVRKLREKIIYTNSVTLLLVQQDILSLDI